ncbi:hypothetical protein HGRIS_011967 [Hohenbuehelia grisea]|uniref:Uncharacterized protein n=1 Tax=Hohenbuehelia grisea TaxID=104357 RepID=A0ABR3JYX5_9AGAR
MWIAVAGQMHTLADFSPWSTGQPVKTAKKFYASQRLFKENREREAAGDDIDSDGERQIECSDDEDAKDGPIAPAPAPSISAWDEPLSPLSSVPPSPTLSASSLPSTSLPPDPQDAAREKEKRIQELTARWDGQPGARRRAKRLRKSSRALRLTSVLKKGLSLGPPSHYCLHFETTGRVMTLLIKCIITFPPRGLRS